MELVCECGKNYEKPEYYDEMMQSESYSLKFFASHCKECFHKRTRKALKSLPLIIKALTDETN